MGPEAHTRRRRLEALGLEALPRWAWGEGGMKVMTYYAGVMYIARPGCGGQRTCVYGARGPRATTAPRVSGVTCVVCENVSRVSRGGALSSVDSRAVGTVETSWRRALDGQSFGSWRLCVSVVCRFKVKLYVTNTRFAPRSNIERRRPIEPTSN